MIAQTFAIASIFWDDWDDRDDPDNYMETNVSIDSTSVLSRRLQSPQSSGSSRIESEVFFYDGLYRLNAFWDDSRDQDDPDDDMDTRLKNEGKVFYSTILSHALIVSQGMVSLIKEEIKTFFSCCIEPLIFSDRVS